MPSDSLSPVSGWRERLTPPPPDSREGFVLAVAIGFALVYVLLLVSQYNAMTRVAFDVTSLSLIVSLVGAFALSSMLGADISTFQRLELELARTVLAYVGSGTPPPSDAPLAGVWRAHVGAAEEYRRMARAHAYALGLFTGAGVLSLGSSLLSGFGVVTATQNVLGLAMFVEWFAFTFLVAAAGAVLLTVGYASPVSVYEVAAPRRWRRNSGRQQAVDGAVREIAWLSEFSRGAREAKISPAGPSVLPSWRE
ncbi:MAG TPA: hypothetical protein VEH10_06440 [Thermoplasmata archaeon]|nr:hypothetical protein [Thermoplasmata archaeon]